MMAAAKSAWASSRDSARMEIERAELLSQTSIASWASLRPERTIGGVIAGIVHSDQSSQKALKSKVSLGSLPT
ncbi:hypothetical protein D3C87_1759900 [compost metagenome]